MKKNEYEIINRHYVRLDKTCIVDFNKIIYTDLTSDYRNGYHNIRLYLEGGYSFTYGPFKTEKLAMEILQKIFKEIEDIQNPKQPTPQILD